MSSKRKDFFSALARVFKGRARPAEIAIDAGNDNRRLIDHPAIAQRNGAFEVNVRQPGASACRA